MRAEKAARLLAGRVKDSECECLMRAEKAARLLAGRVRDSECECFERAESVEDTTARSAPGFSHVSL